MMLLGLGYINMSTQVALECKGYRSNPSGPHSYAISPKATLAGHLEPNPRRLTTWVVLSGLSPSALFSLSVPSRAIGSHAGPFPYFHQHFQNESREITSRALRLSSDSMIRGRGSFRRFLTIPCTGQDEAFSGSEGYDGSTW